MTKEELIERLLALVEDSPSESTHINADDLLVEWINDPDILAAYDAIKKWYS